MVVSVAFGFGSCSLNIRSKEVSMQVKKSGLEELGMSLSTAKKWLYECKYRQQGAKHSCSATERPDLKSLS